MKWYWVGLLLAMAIPAHADVLPSPEAARDLADKVMEFISKGDVDNGLALVKPYTGLAGVEIDGLGQKLEEVFVSGKYRLGNTIGYEFLGKETLGSSLLTNNRASSLPKARPGMDIHVLQRAGWLDHQSCLLYG